MSGKESKRSKGRRAFSSQSKNSANSHSGSGSGVPVTSTNGTSGAMGGAAPSPLQPFGTKLTMNVCDVATEFGRNLKPSLDVVDLPTVAPKSLESPQEPPPAIGRGQNPYLEQCMYCGTPRLESQDGDEGLGLLDLQLDGDAVISGAVDSQSFSSLKLEIWTCSKCRKLAGNNFQTFLEANLPQPAYELPTFLHDREACVDNMSCLKCQEELNIHERETIELQENWVELRSVVSDIYACEEEPTLSDEDGERLKYLVDKLCSRDPHQLFLRLDSQAREVVVGIKKQLHRQLSNFPQGCPSSPEEALAFTSSLLEFHELLTKKAHLLARFLGGMSEHLKRFKVTWELLNKHLFHSIVHSDQSISSCGPTILEQLRQGSVMQEKSKDDPYFVVRKELLKFQNEMAVVEVVWRDCRQLIKSYCQEEVKNTQKQVQILREHLIKEPMMDEALSETMRNLMSGHKSSAERVLCQRCKRERCTCDECTITHMITCGNISPGNDEEDKGPELSHTVPNSFNFALDHTVRNMVMDITPPSMSSTTSSSGSVSPITIDDKLFYDCQKEDFNEALLNPVLRDGQACSTADDIDENAGDDEEEEDEEPYGFVDSQDAECDEPHALQVPLIELKDGEAALWDAVQEQQLKQVNMVDQGMSNLHNCAQCHEGQPCVFQPRLDPELSRQLDAELTKNGLLPSGDCGILPEENVNKESGGGEGEADPSAALHAPCQCHACLKQSGQVISTTLPLQVPVSAPPAELHLYPHIHGLPHQHPQRFMTFDLPCGPFMPPIKIPAKIDWSDPTLKLDWNDPALLRQHIYDVYSDWENSLQTRPGSLAAQHLHQRLSALNSDLLPQAPPTSSQDNSSSLSSTPSPSSSSAFKSVAGKHLAASVLPALGSLGGFSSTPSSTASGEGSSVDPTRAALDSLLKLPVSCLSNPVTQSAFSTSSSSSGTSLSTSTSPPASQGNHGPPCSRPAPVGGNAAAAASSKWERGQHCSKTPGGVCNNTPASKAGHMVHHPFKGSLPPQVALKNLVPGATTTGGGGTVANGTLPYRSMLPCSHAPPPPPLKTSNCASACSPPTPPHPSPAPACTSTYNLPSMVNNIGVGTSGHCTGDHHGFEGHLPDDNCDSIDDSCSEKSSTTSSTTQKEGKYCDCCYCEFFGHNNTQVAKTSTNYAQIKDRLQKKLKKRQTEKPQSQYCTNSGQINELVLDEKDPLEKKGLEGLLSFINGTESHSDGLKEKELTAKAAKRARQKQRKLEEKAKQEKKNSITENKPSLDHNLHHLISQALDLGSQADNNMVKPKVRKLRQCEEKASFGVVKGDVSVPVCTQEIPRSSLIIESTRPTISRSSTKDGDKSSHGPNGVTKAGNPQHMMQFLHNIKQQQQNAKKAPVSLSSKISAPSQGKCNGDMKSLSVTSKPISNPSSKEVSKDNTTAMASSKNQRHSQQQLLSTKSVNGKVPVSSQSLTPNTMVNGKSGSAQGHTIKQSHRQSSPGKQQTVTNGPVKNGKQHVGKPQAVHSSTSTISLPTNNTADSPGAGSLSSNSSISPPAGSKPAQQTKAVGKSKKNKKKNKNGDLSCVDEIFMPKPEGELDGEVDEFERELEEFKRFCFEPAGIKERRKLAVNVNLKDIFKKKSALV